MPGKKMMGYKKGGSLEMVEKDGKKVPFYAADGKGKMAEGGKVKKKKTKKKTDKKKEMKFSADDGGSISGPISPNRQKILDEIKANNSKPTPSFAKSAMNNTTPAPKPTVTPGAPGGMGAMMKPGMGDAPKPQGMKAGGKVKKKAKSYGHGGKVRGAGIAKKGVRKCKMR